MGWVAVLLPLVLLAGCTTYRWVYDKPGATETQRKQDEGECLRASFRGETVPRAGFLALDRQLYTRCMEGRGYVARQEEAR